MLFLLSQQHLLASIILLTFFSLPITLKTRLRLYIRNLTWWFSNLHRKHERVRHLVSGSAQNPGACPSRS